jgi:hypothetical protein
MESYGICKTSRVLHTKTEYCEDWIIASPEYFSDGTPVSIYEKFESEFEDKSDGQT